MNIKIDQISILELASMKQNDATVSTLLNISISINTPINSWQMLKSLVDADPKLNRIYKFLSALARNLNNSFRHRRLTIFISILHPL